MVLRLEDVKLNSYAMSRGRREYREKEGAIIMDGFVSQLLGLLDIEFRTRIILNTKSIFRGKYSQKHVHQYNFENTGYMLIINHVIEYCRVS